MRLSQEWGKIICNYMSLGSNLHTWQNWLSHIHLDWHEIFAIAVEELENLEVL